MLSEQPTNLSCVLERGGPKRTWKLNICHTQDQIKSNQIKFIKQQRAKSHLQVAKTMIKTFKSFENLLNFDKVTESIKVGTMLRHGVDLAEHCWV